MTFASLVISVLVPFAWGSCLPDAIAPEARQDLVNPNGETYPVGLYSCGWAASRASHVLAATLIKEVLGYNTQINEELGSGTVAGYYGITGCRTPNNAADRGCMQGVSYYHVHMEAWDGYRSDMAYIRKTYASMAPINKGSMGYKGVTTMYIPASVQAQAYSTAGKALEFFRAWNASWNRPSDYFNTISSVDQKNLMPCSKPALSDDAAMQRHIKHTGDADGVVIDTDGKHFGRCDDGFWWLAPSCRSNSSQCVPMLTGGNGWGLEEFMQKYTAFNMPGAIATAADWGNYTSLPLTGDIAMYWWTPDPSFLAVAPLPVVFPSLSTRLREEGILLGIDAGAEIETLVSSDLAILSPLVERFADNIDITLSQMTEMLMDHVNNPTDTWEEVTCRWIKGNEATWRKWIPDESECYPGFGLYDSVLKEFTDVRINATNKVVCEACPPGTFSQLLEDGKDGNGVTYICLPCEPGTSQASGAQMSCKPCKSGEYQAQNRSTECNRCALNFYQDEEGQLACKACPAGTNTLGFGSIAPADCGCAEGYIDMDSTGAFDCVKCSEGMSCPALSTLVDLKEGESTNNLEFWPQIMPGFFAERDYPTQVFRCKDERSCKGGKPGSCGGGLIGTPCAECAEGSTFTGSECEVCGGWREFLWVVAVCCIFGFLILAYYMTTSKVTAKASVLFATTASFGMLVMSMQNLGLVGMMTVEWPVSLQGLFSVCQFLLLEIDSYGFSCIAGQSEPVRYLMSALIFPIGVAWLALGYGVSQLFPKKYRWEGPKVVSTMGAFCQVGFSTMSATALAPMMCYKHPNGLRSILKYPGVICGTSEHTSMLVTAWLLLIIFVLGFVALCSYAVIMVPRWSARRKDHFVGSVRDYWWRWQLRFCLVVAGALQRALAACSRSGAPFAVQLLL